jgi:aspartate/methionine/tyrosine aminotransferase
VRRELRPDTRAIVVNFPHNPTGAHIDRATLDALVAIAEEADAYLFSDEVYRWLEHPPSALLPGAAELSERAVSLGVLSKTFALPGLRIGWLACRDHELLARLAAIKDYMTICSSAPSEILALVALRRRDDVVARSRAIVDANLPLLDDFFARWDGAFEWVRPRGAPIGFPRLLADVAVDEFARELVEREGVLILPGSIYEHPGNHFRIGFGRRNMPEALGRLERFAGARLSRRAPLRERSQAAIDGASSWASSSPGSCVVVMPTTCIPAARPASTPAGASSSTTQSAGAAPSSRAASR